MHKVLQWITFRYYGPIYCLFQALAACTRYLPHTHSFKRKLNNIRCSVATTYDNKLIAEIRAETLVDRSLASGSSQHNIKEGDGDIFTRVHLHRLASP